MSSPNASVAILMLMILQVPSQVDQTQCFVHRVTLVGSTGGVTDEALRKACNSIEEGKVYTAAALDKAIKAINKLGVFRKVTRADCKVTYSNMPPDTVDIAVRLRPKAPPEGKSAEPK